MNKNDLRYRKTEKNLFETYTTLVLTSKKSVTLVKLCEEAMINKSTFYQHYSTIDQLHEAVCRQHVSRTLAEIPGIENIFENTEKLVRNAIEIFDKYREKLHSLFNGDIDQLSLYIEEEFIKLSLHPEFSEQEKMKIRFIVGGTTRVFFNEKTEEAVSFTIAMIDKLLNL